MSDSKEMFDLLHEIVESIDADQSNADWGRAFGQAIYETGDEDLILYVLSDAGEKYRSAELSKLRKRSRRAAYSLPASTNGERVEAVQSAFDFPCVVPGFPQLPISQTNHLFLVDACAAARRHIDGAIQNVELMERVRDASAPWPEESIASLLKRGAMTPDVIVGIERSA